MVIQPCSSNAAQNYSSRWEHNPTFWTVLALSVLGVLYDCFTLLDVVARKAIKVAGTCPQHTCPCSGSPHALWLGLCLLGLNSDFEHLTEASDSGSKGFNFYQGGIRASSKGGSW